MIYKCKIMQVINYDDGYMIGTRQLDLPFPPMGELEFSGILYRPGDSDSLESEAPRVVYDADSDIFVLVMSIDERLQLSESAMEYAMRVYHPDFRWMDHPGQGEWVG